MTNVTEESGSELFNLLNPENLSEESLIHILQQRLVIIDDVNRSKKEDLVSLFHRTVTPQPQRVMPKNRIGKVLKSAQEQIASRKPKSIETPNLLTAAQSTASKAQSSSQKGGLVMSANIQSPGYRLKPPPVVLNNKNRIAKLKRTSSSQLEGEHPNGKFTKIKNPSSSVSSSSTLLSSPVAIKKQCIKSSTATSPKACKPLPVKRPSQETEQNPVNDSSPKKKIKTITWP
ncbi:ashwin-like [Anneissia japonica]|uniref:ashwin-like n=1 Tax=Anneissia japonica TaxID=1529436 RepID=UPI001425B17B|nr:ashwin-like [Anneissia japonica]